LLLIYSCQTLYIDVWLGRKYETARNLEGYNCSTAPYLMD
jgi:hypothetical protein